MRCIISCNIRRERDTAGDFLYSDYIEFFEAKGISLILLPNAAKNPEDYFDISGAQGLILSGGNDLGSEPVRDRQEKRLMDIAIRRSLPVFGICRGMQFINRYFGGSLPENLPIGADGGMKHVVSEHLLRVVDAGMASSIGTDRIRTNSFHRQGIKESGLAPGLDILAVSESDGLIEALRHKDGKIMGVQWHPERKSPENKVNDIIIGMFKEKAVNKSGK